jgi:hypothetical protein
MAKKTTRKPAKFIKDDSMSDAEKLAFAMDYLTERYEAQKESGRPSARITATFPTIEEVFDLARKL